MRVKSASNNIEKPDLTFLFVCFNKKKRGMRRKSVKIRASTVGLRLYSLVVENSKGPGFHSLTLQEPKQPH